MANKGFFGNRHMYFANLNLFCSFFVPVRGTHVHTAIGSLLLPCEYVDRSFARALGRAKGVPPHFIGQAVDFFLAVQTGVEAAWLGVEVKALLVFEIADLYGARE